LAHPPLPKKRGIVVFVRQLTTASLLPLALISVPGSAHAQAASPLAFCKQDAARLCPGVTPGGGKLLGCLKQHENEVSVGCAKELKAVKTKMGK
jgi:Cysteine rich repeat